MFHNNSIYTSAGCTWQSEALADCLINLPALPANP